MLTLERSDLKNGGELAGVIGVLQQELRLVGELRQTLVRQREAVAADDAGAIEATVHAISRTLFTLDEARRRRVGATTELTGRPQATLDDLETVLGELPEPIVSARAALRVEAAAAARELATNQVVLRRALEAGDAFLQQLFAGAADPTPVYTRRERATESRTPAPAVLLDRTA